MAGVRIGGDFDNGNLNDSSGFENQKEKIRKCTQPFDGTHKYSPIRLLNLLERQTLVVQYTCKISKFQRYDIDRSDKRVSLATKQQYSNRKIHFIQTFDD